MAFDFGGLGSAIGGIADIFMGSDQARKQAHLQKEFAQNGIQWKVEDAKKAGIHPLYALGANTMSYSPTTVGTDLAGVGQNLGRAIDSTRTEPQKIDAVQETLGRLAIERGGLENELLRQQIASSAIATTRQSAGSPTPAFPLAAGDYVIPGQGNSGLITEKKMPRMMDPARPIQEPGSVADRGFTNTSTGIAPVYSADAKERLEDDFLGMLAWNVRNRLLPSINTDWGSIPHKPPPGEKWIYNPIRQEYQLVPMNRTTRKTGRR